MLDIEAVESILCSDTFVRDCRKNVMNIKSTIENMNNLKQGWNGQEIRKKASQYLQEVIEAIPSDNHTYLLGFFSDFSKNKFHPETTAIEETLEELHDIKVELERVKGTFENRIRKISFEDYWNDLIDGIVNDCKESVIDDIRYQLKELLPPEFVAKIMGLIKTAITILGATVVKALRYVVKFLSYGAWVYHKIIDIVDSFTIQKTVDESITLMMPIEGKMNRLIDNMESIRASIVQDLKRIARENNLPYNEANLDMIKSFYYDTL